MLNRKQSRAALENPVVGRNNRKQAFDCADAKGIRLAVAPGKNDWELSNGKTMNKNQVRNLTTAINDFMGRLAAKVKQLKAQNFS